MKAKKISERNIKGWYGIREQLISKKLLNDYLEIKESMMRSIAKAYGEAYNHAGSILFSYQFHASEHFRAEIYSSMKGKTKKHLTFDLLMKAKEKALKAALSWVENGGIIF